MHESLNAHAVESHKGLKLLILMLICLAGVCGGGKKMTMMEMITHGLAHHLYGAPGNSFAPNFRGYSYMALFSFKKIGRSPYTHLYNILLSSS